MNRPSKEDVLGRLRSFAQGMRDTAKLAETESFPGETVDSLENIGWKAIDVAERLNATGRDYVPPDIAQTLTELADTTEQAAASIENVAVTATVRALGQALKAFVQQYDPKLTNSGKFMFKLDEGD